MWYKAKWSSNHSNDFLSHYFLETTCVVLCLISNHETKCCLSLSYGFTEETAPNSFIDFLMKLMVVGSGTRTCCSVRVTVRAIHHVLEPIPGGTLLLPPPTKLLLAGLSHTPAKPWSLLGSRQGLDSSQLPSWSAQLMLQCLDALIPLSPT